MVEWWIMTLKITGIPASIEAIEPYFSSNGQVTLLQDYHPTLIIEQLIHPFPVS